VRNGKAWSKHDKKRRNGASHHGFTVGGEDFVIPYACGFPGIVSQTFVHCGRPSIDRLLENITGTYWRNW